MQIMNPTWVKIEKFTPKCWMLQETVKMIDIVIKNLDVVDSKRSDTGSLYDPFLIGIIMPFSQKFLFLNSEFDWKN